MMLCDSDRADGVRRVGGWRVRMRVSQSLKKGRWARCAMRPWRMLERIASSSKQSPLAIASHGVKVGQGLDDSDRAE